MAGHGATVVVEVVPVDVPAHNVRDGLLRGLVRNDSQRYASSPSDWLALALKQVLHWHQMKT